jgi:predicted metal-dependent enzyme (double-stranded beta helix superfamily)
MGTSGFSYINQKEADKMSAFRNLVGAVKDAYNEGRSEEWLLFRASDAVGELLQDKSFLKDFGLPVAGEYQTYLLYKDPERGFIVTASTSRDKLYRPPHDHGPTWAVYGVYSGQIQMTRYKRVDDRRVEGYAELDQVADFAARGGMVDAIMPGGIHELRYGGDAGISVIVRSSDPAEFLRGRYNPAEKKVEMFRGVSTGGRHEMVDLREKAERILS